ncbi:MAG TPA: hypothetical protein VFX12_00555 [Vicinamibacterales bacterium]|nr:hypothetical protein [Vicinamibacterales bacterium]
MTALTEDAARALLDSHDLIAAGARADEARRARHGGRTSFVRVFEVHVDAVPASMAEGISAGEVRIVGAPGSIAAAAAAVRAARAAAGDRPVTAFSLADVMALGERGPRAALQALVEAGLETIADVPLDRLQDPAAALAAVREAGLRAPRVTVHRLEPGRRLAVLQLARDLQASVGGIEAFAPLARESSASAPTTGYDDVRQVALARLVADNIPHIQVDWALYGPKLAQVALTMGADDVDGVSATAGDLGRRRSPIEEIRGNIVAAGLEPVERTARFEPRR